MVIDLAHSEGLRASPMIGFCAGSRLDGNLQFALPVSPESIGGGVFDLSGKLLGIVVAGVGENSQIAQAVPGYRLQAIISHLKTLGDRHAGFVGITSVEIEIYPPLDLPPLSRVDPKPGQTLDRGVIVTDIVPGSSAEMAGIRTGDLIYSYDNQLVSSAIDLANWVKQTPPGRMVIVDVLRHASHFQVQMKIGSKELAPTVANARLASGGDANGRLVDSLRTELARLRTNINMIEKELQRVSQ
jgi:S1-C subfamily serine protease